MTRKRSAGGLGTTHREHLAKVCTQIGNLCADAEGFVAVRTLLERFQTELIARPLLVEAMIAQRPHVESDGIRWAVLIDSERFPVSEQDVARETFCRTLPVRFRFTVAHELAHSISFRPTEFGMMGQYPKATGVSRRDVVETVEHETDRVAPLLLLPDATLRKCLAGRKALDAPDLKVLCDNFGVSRHVLVNRLALLLRPADRSDMRESEALANVGIGLGEWDNHGRARLRKWPLFVNFHNQIVPALFAQLAKQDYLAVDSLIDDESFALCGGVNSAAELTCDAGLPGLAADEKMDVRMTVEASSKRPGARFLFALRKRRPMDTRRIA
jgi:IrrE N-terminal-like domain